MEFKKFDLKNIELPKLDLGKRDIPKIDTKNIEFPKVDFKSLEKVLSPNKGDQETPDISFNHQDQNRDLFMLHGKLASEGYDWWWQNFTGVNEDTGEERSFYIEFFTINPALGGKEPVFGQLEENQKNGVKPSYMMVNVGAWGEKATQLHRFFGWDDVTIKADAPFLISADNCFLSETRTLGKVKVTAEEALDHPEWMSDSGSMIWDLKIDKKIAFNVGYGASRMVRDMDAFQMFWHAEGMKTEFTGDVIYNGTHYSVKPETSHGYSDKNWGSNFTSPWIWLSSDDITRKATGEKLENSVFDIGGGRPMVGHHAMEGKLLSAFWIEGKPYEFNFSKVWTLTKTKFKVKENKKEVIWQVEQETPTAKVQIQVTCEKSKMMKIRYEAPDGTFRHKNLWNGGDGVATIKIFEKQISLKDKWEWQLVEELSAKHVRCEYGEFDDKAEEKEQAEKAKAEKKAEAEQHKAEEKAAKEQAKAEEKAAKVQAKAEKKAEKEQSEEEVKETEE